MSTQARSFSLKLLGGCSLEGPHGLLQGRAAQRRRLAFLALVAAAGRQGRSRDQLAAYLYPESSDERARHQLSDTLHVLRSGLGQQALLTGSDRIALNGDVISCDVWLFEDAVRRADRAAAVATYAGPFLDGFHISGAPEFERWVDAERARLETAYAAALERWAEEAERSDAVEAAGWWRRLAALRPYDGRIAWRVVTALEAAGDRVGAIRHVQAHAELLAQDLQAEPDQSLLEMAERLRSPSPGNAGGPYSMIAAEGSASRAGEGTIEAGAPMPVPAGSAAPERRGRTGVRSALRALAVVTALVVVGLAAYARWRPAVESGPVVAPGIRTIAVMPFTSLGEDPANDYFSEGISEQILNALAMLPSLHVAARTSSFNLGSRNLGVQEIGRMLDVAHVLEGSVQREGRRVRIRVQLVDTRTGFQVWSGRYDEKVNDIFAVQDEIARAVVHALQPALDPRPWHPTAAATDISAYDAYLKGRFVWAQGKYQKAIDFFRSALATDPDYAPAYAGIADAFTRIGDTFALPGEEGYAKAIAAARRAIMLDERSAEAHSALAHALTHQFRWAEAEREYQRALELNPSYATAHSYYAVHLLGTGRAEGAARHARRALQLDPLGGETAIMSAAALRGARRFDESVATLQNQLELNPSHPALYFQLGLTYVAMGRHVDGITALRRHATLAGGTGSRVMIARALAQVGNADAARDTLRAVLGSFPEEEIDPFHVAAALAALGERDSAFHWLEKIMVRRSPNAQGLYAPFMDELRDDARFARLVEQLGLPAAPSLSR